MKAVFRNGYGFSFLGGMLVDITVSVISSVVERRRVEFNLNCNDFKIRYAIGDGL